MVMKSGNTTVVILWTRYVVADTVDVRVRLWVVRRVCSCEELSWVLPQISQIDRSRVERVNQEDDLMLKAGAESVVGHVQQGQADKSRRANNVCPHVEHYGSEREWKLGHANFS